MPKTSNTAAKSTHAMASSRRKQLLMVGLVVIWVIIVIGILLSNSSSLQTGGVNLLILLFALRFIPDLFESYAKKKGRTIHRADRGVDAEEDIAGLLANLNDDYLVIHDIKSPYGNIDYIVISRISGIFLLETKSHRGTVTTTDSEILVNGRSPEKDFVAQTLNNSYWLRDETERLLKVKPWITPLVVFTKAFVRFGKPVKGIRVINYKYLLQTLQTEHRDSTFASTIWVNREQMVSHLTGKKT